MDLTEFNAVSYTHLDVYKRQRQKIESVEGVNSATINLVFEPEWMTD